MERKKLDFKRTGLLMLPGICAAFTLFVFAPTEFYMNHVSDFWFGYDQILPVLLMLAVACAALATLVLAVLPRKASTVLEALIFTGGILLYIQGNYLVVNYGTLNGTAIDWSAYRRQMIVDTAVWAAVIAAAIVLAVKLKDRFVKVMRIAAAIVLVTQIVTLGTVALLSPERSDESEGYLSKVDEFTVSSSSNTAVILLDCLDAKLFENLYEADGAYFDGELADFTFYPNTVGGATRTKYAIPFIFTGQTNTQKVSYPVYLTKIYSDSPFFKALRSGDYDVGIYTQKDFVDLSHADVIDNYSTGQAKASSRFGLTKKYMKLIAFRYAPSALARRFWMYSGDFDQFKAGEDAGEYAMNDVMFYQELIGRGLSVGTDRSCFRFYHLTGAHAPYTMNADCQKVPFSEGSEAEQALGCFKIIDAYIGQLKAVGVYEKTTLIIMADHGYENYGGMEQNPVFIVKLPGESHAFGSSDIPLSYSMLPNLFADAVTGHLPPDLSAYAVEGDRFFYDAVEGVTQITITEYVIRGEAGDNSACKKTGVVYYGDTSDPSRDYKLGEVISFGDAEFTHSSRKYIVSGFSVIEGTATWTLGNRAELELELQGDYNNVRVTVNIQSTVHNEQQTATIYANDHLLGSWTQKGAGSFSFIVPHEYIPDGRLNLVFQLPGAVSPAQLKNSGDNRILSLRFESMVIESTSDAPDMATE